MSSPLETGIVLPVQELADVIPPLRRRIETPPPRGLPAHVTVLYPWVDPADLDAHLGRLATLASSMAPVGFDLTGIGWFGEEVVWARPEPDAGIRGLMARLVAAWPEHRPYRGLHGDDPIPHVTIADGAPRDDLVEAANEVDGLLPLSVTVSELWVMVGNPDPPRWTVAAAVPLLG